MKFSQTDIGKKVVLELDAKNDPRAQEIRIDKILVRGVILSCNDVDFLLKPFGYSFGGPEIRYIPYEKINSVVECS